LKRDLEHTATAPRPRTESRRAPGDGRIRAVAVLPFESFSSDPADEFFALGLLEALIACLTRMESLRIASRTTVLKYKGTSRSVGDVAEELDVDAVLEGSVLRSGDRVRVSAELVHAVFDRPVWAQSYDRTLTDVFALQSELAQTISAEVQGKLAPAQVTGDAPAPAPVPSEAKHHYLRGEYLRDRTTEEGLKSGISHLEKAVALEPAYALAYVGLAESYNRMGFLGVLPGHFAYPHAKNAAIKARQLDESLADAHAALANTRMQFGWRWSLAEAELQRAFELQPDCSSAHHVSANLLAARGRLAEAREEMLRAKELNPLSCALNVDLALHCYLAQDYEKALAQLQDTLELFPESDIAHIYRARIFAHRGNEAAALADLQAAMALSRSRKRFLCELGHAYATLGRESEALEVMDELVMESKRSYVPTYNIAVLSVALGAIDRAFACLEDALDERNGGMLFLNVDPRFALLRRDARFSGLLQRMKLSDVAAGVPASAAH
jgi:TolB-like protein/tetratricopeptide (TPR) repeat protein